MLIRQKLSVFNLYGRHAGHDPQEGEKTLKKKKQESADRGRNERRSFPLWKSFVRRLHSHLNLVHV